MSWGSGVKGGRWGSGVRGGSLVKALPGTLQLVLFHHLSTATAYTIGHGAFQEMVTLLKALREKERI